MILGLTGLALAQDPGETTEPYVVEVVEQTDPPPAPLTAAELGLLQRYGTERLRLEPKADGFRVRTGVGVDLTVGRFARLVDDQPVLSAIKTDRDHAQTHYKALTYGGLGLMGVSGVTLIAGLPDRTPPQREDLAYTSLFMAVAGGMMMAIAPKATARVERPTYAPYYDKDTLEEKVALFNQQLKTKMDIDPLLERQQVLERQQALEEARAEGDAAP